MTHKQFWQDPYQTRLQTRITSVNDALVTLESTIFYALSGGQESDSGTIGGHIVLQASKADHDIVYTLSDNHGLNAGDSVQVEIDWERRYRLMKLHFAAEIILELIYQRLGPVQKIGAHIAADKARIDFEWPQSIAGEFAWLLEQANTIIASNQVILSAWSDEAAQRRYWKIAEFGEVPCGGTHLHRTGEIGAIALKRKNIGKGKERVEIYLDTCSPD
ncbi:alanyl-tRNA editing protein [Silvimonas sp.]|uniref:alanyl-tRNA editing protein n=1 Tax=Silvimonas sp. TaxID=2650811 RepID=UPI0028448D48|nr:alanyl-tRNA editing protein [Silvimonas sp.]MDR3428805.1 alanyl-tRNA editing protein [Silvimonas sp.]